MIIFIVIAIAAISSAIGVLILPPIKSALSLMGTFFCLAILYLFLSAEFLAALQVLVYAGAIMVLFLFVIMLLDFRSKEFVAFKKHSIAIVFTVALLVLLIIPYVSFVSDLNLCADSKNNAMPPKVCVSSMSESFGKVHAFGTELFANYLLPFEITSLMLLLAIVGTVVLSKKHGNSKE